ncbi:MFS transporter [Streptomyces griseorubiginosus]|uniref:MFS transporter n=1 Tax=Streptomyces griseorubiginosus TaxID=67304 RepID=UPI001AD7AF79|nr:MFS transporter [Streptomyces griseorubiginosus]MBO4253429.1 MFS transporter [Streptomyces griseorubiginosus]
MSCTPVGRRPSYAVVLRVPYARRTFAFALLGRLSYGVVPLSVMLAVTRATGSYAVAGTVMALFSGTSVFLSPARAALIDRHGPRGALVPMTAVYASLLGLLTVLVWRPGVPALALGAVTAAAGACTPPLGPTMRAVWTRLTPDRTLLQLAYSLDGVAEELLFVSGPLLVGLLVGTTAPATAIAVGTALMLAGTAGFVTSPAVRAQGPAEKAAVDGASASPEEDGRPTKRRSVLRGILQPVVAAVGVGLALGVVDLVVVAFAEQRGQGDDAVAWTLAGLSGGSAVGGLLNGAVAWRVPARVRLPFTAAGLGLALLGAGFADGLGTLAAALAVSGSFVAPALTTAYLVADEAAAPEARVRAGAWVNTGVNAGSTAGAAAAGLLVGALPTALCFAAAGAAALLTALVTSRGAVRTRRGTPGTLPQWDAEESTSSV